MWIVRVLWLLCRRRELDAFATSPEFTQKQLAAKLKEFDGEYKRANNQEQSEYHHMYCFEEDYERPTKNA